jgi:CTP-dependent riboflavin kinase
MKEPEYTYIVLKGKVTEGLREGRFFTRLPWARKQFVDKLGIDPYPGTLNIELFDDVDVEKYQIIAAHNGIEIIPAGPKYCKAKCFPILIGDNEEIKGALVIPQVPDYEKRKLEIISTVRLKDALSLKTNDIVSIRVSVSN